MKYQTVNHTKMKRLGLKVGSKLLAVGIIESLIALTISEARAGDIGRLSDEDIALGIGWDRDPAELIDALVESGWVDRDDTHRLVMHDWHDHAPEFLQKLHRRVIAKGEPAFFVTYKGSAGQVPPCPDKSRRGGTNSHSQTKPNLTKENPPTPRDNADEAGQVQPTAPKADAPTEPDGFTRFWQAWPKSTRKADRAKCAEHWRANKLDGEADEIVRGVEAAKKSRDWTKNGGEFIPAPIVWLRRRGWEAFARTAPPSDAPAPVRSLDPWQRLAALEPITAASVLDRAASRLKAGNAAERTAAGFSEEVRRTCPHWKTAILRVFASSPESVPSESVVLGGEAK